jgi:hypothetical protein
MAFAAFLVLVPAGVELFKLRNEHADQQLKTTLSNADQQFRTTLSIQIGRADVAKHAKNSTYWIRRFRMATRRTI